MFPLFVSKLLYHFIFVKQKLENILWFLLIGHGSNSDPYRVLSFSSDSVRALGFSSFFGVRALVSLLEDINVVERVVRRGVRYTFIGGSEY